MNFRQLLSAPDGQAFRISPQIRFVDFDGFVLLMDLRSGEYLALDPEASEAWLRAARPDGATAEATRFFAGFLARGLIERVPAEQPPAASPARPRRAETRRVRLRPPLVVHAWWQMASTWISLRRNGFGSVYGALLEDRDETGARPGVAVDRAVDAFVLAENLFWFRSAPDDCLPRSLALFRYLRSIGIPATHRIGGFRFPSLLMHAWVESDGRPVVDDPEFIRSLTVVASLPLPTAR